MINLSECKFGDILRTRDGGKVLFVCKNQPFNIFPSECDYEPDDKFICILELDESRFEWMTYDIRGRNIDVRVPKTRPENEIVGKWTIHSNTEEYTFGNKFKTSGGEMVVFIAKLRADSSNDSGIKFAFIMPNEDTFALLLLEENDLHDKNNPNSIVGKWEDEGEYIGPQEIDKENMEECINGKSE